MSTCHGRLSLAPGRVVGRRTWTAVGLCGSCGVPRRQVAGATRRQAGQDADIAAWRAALEGRLEIARTAKTEGVGTTRGVCTQPADAGKRRESLWEVCHNDVIGYCVSREIGGSGATQVHVKGCLRVDGQECDCPMRLAASVVETMVSKLRTRFGELGTGGHGRPRRSGAKWPVPCTSLSHYGDCARKGSAAGKAEAAGGSLERRSGIG